MHFRRAFVALALALGTVAADDVAEAATRPYATLADDGTLAKDFTQTSSIEDIAKKVLANYEAAGQKRPDVLSVWTTFPMTGNDVVTLFLPLKNDVSGLGLEDQYPEATFETPGTSPVRAVLLHNDIRALAKRAQFNGSTDVDGMAEYLFLLELSHMWGPATRVPAKSGADEHGLIGFPFHWSFWMDAGGSVSGGNAWKDNGDGTFTTTPQRPGTLTFSMLDLYLMGLATADEVPPFGLLTDVTVTGNATDPMTKRAVSPTTFPWFEDTPVTAKATRVSYTIEDVVAANGKRSPDVSLAPRSFTLGIALVVGKGTSDEDRAAYETLMDGYAPKLAPAFERATHGRGKLEVVSSVTIDDVDAGAETSSGGSEPVAPGGATAPVKESSSCALGGGGEQAMSPLFAVAVAAVARSWRRRR